MSNCDLIKGCLFFNDKMEDKPGMTIIFKNNYCQGDFTNCARRKVASSLGRECVPTDLYPNQHDRVNEIIKSN